MSDVGLLAAVPLATGAADPQRQETARGAQRPDRGLGSTAIDMVDDMAELRIGDMLASVPPGQMRMFPRAKPDDADERYFAVQQSWDYNPVRFEWLNSPGLPTAPWAGSRRRPRIPLTTLPAPEVVFDGPAKDVVDFYNTASHAYFISDPLFQLIESMDPGFLEHVELRLPAQDAELPFHLVMTQRVVESIDTARSNILIKDDGSPGVYIPRVRFPDGMAFDNEALKGAATFSDLDLPGWYWSKDLIEQAQAQGIRGLYAKSVATSRLREIARL